jgi:type VI secretion system secreted protein Hcp
MAQADIILKVDGITGESLDDKHKGEIQLDSFAWDAENSTTIGSATGGAGAGKVRFGAFSCKKRYDKSSPPLFTYLSGGTHFKEVKLTVRKAGGGQQEYLIWKLGTVFLTKVAMSSDATDPGIVYESLHMVFAKMAMEYREQRADGSLGPSVKQGWDQVANKKI